MKKLSILLILLLLPYANAKILARSEIYGEVVNGNVQGNMVTYITLGTTENIKFALTPDGKIQEYAVAPQKSLIVEGEPYGSTVLVAPVEKVAFIFKSHDGNYYVFPVYRIASSGYSSSYAPYHLKIYEEGKTWLDKIYLIGADIKESQVTNSQENVVVTALRSDTVGDIKIDYTGCSIETYGLGLPDSDWAFVYGYDADGNVFSMVFKWNDLLQLLNINVETPVTVTSSIVDYRIIKGNPNESSINKWSDWRKNQFNGLRDYTPKEIDEKTSVYVANSGSILSATDDRVMVLFLEQSNKIGEIIINAIADVECNGDSLEMQLKLKPKSTSEKIWIPKFIENYEIELVQGKHTDTNMPLTWSNFEVNLTANENVGNKYVLDSDGNFKVNIKCKAPYNIGGYSTGYVQWVKIHIRFSGVTDTWAKFFYNSPLQRMFYETVQEGKNPTYSIYKTKITTSDKTCDLLSQVLTRFTGSGEQSLYTVGLKKIDETDWLPRNYIESIKFEGRDKPEGQLFCISSNYATPYFAIYVFSGAMLLPNITITTPLEKYNTVIYVPTKGKPQIINIATTVESVSGKEFTLEISVKNIGSSKDDFYGILSLPPEIVRVTEAPKITLDVNEVGKLTYGLKAVSGITDMREVKGSIIVVSGSGEISAPADITFTIKPAETYIPEVLKSAVITVKVRKEYEKGKYKGVEGIEVNLSDGISLSKETDSSGYVDFEVVKGTYTVYTVNPDTGKTYSKTLSVESGSAYSIVFTFPLEEAKVEAKNYLPYIIAGTLFILMLGIIKKKGER
jgi:hypothetical protein